MRCSEPGDVALLAFGEIARASSDLPRSARLPTPFPVAEFGSIGGKRERMDDDENINPVDSVLSSLEEAALDADPSSDSDSPRDAWWLRWLKFGSVIVVPAVALGLGFMFYDCIEQYRDGTTSEFARATRNVNQDSLGAMKVRFGIGAVVGGGLGMIYVVRCIVRKADP